MGMHDNGTAQLVISRRYEAGWRFPLFLLCGGASGTWPPLAGGGRCDLNGQAYIIFEPYYVILPLAVDQRPRPAEPTRCDLMGIEYNTACVFGNNNSST